MGKWIVAGIVALVEASVLVGQTDDEETEPSEPSSDELRYDARRVCHDFIDDRLKSPASSDFEWTSDMNVTYSGGIYVVGGKVDAQNSFGAMIRSDYACTVGIREIRATREHHWTH